MTNPLIRTTQPSPNAEADAALAAGLHPSVLPAQHAARREPQRVPPSPFVTVAEDAEFVLKGTLFQNGSILIAKDKAGGQISVTFVPTPV